MPKTLRQTATFKARSRDVYDALMTSRGHARITGAKATVSGKVGGKFRVFDGYATGVNLELSPGKKIVQSWRASDWPTDHYSTVSFALKRVKGGTRLTFTQTGVPDDQYAGIKMGWIEYYWKPMKALRSGRGRR
jgi:activator of HSP90 ATPase